MAIRNYRRAIARDAECFEAYRNLGNALKDADRAQEAIDCYHSQQGSQLLLYVQQGNYGLAMSCCNEVLRINPMATEGLVNRGNIYIEIGKVNEAIQDYTQAIANSPTMADTHILLALAYTIKSYRQALMLRPDFPRATCNLFHSLQCVCDWDNQEEMFIEVEGILRRQIEVIAFPLDPMLALDISHKFAKYCSLIAARYVLSPFTHPPPLSIKGCGRNSRLRVGYVSSDFGDHPVSHLMCSVFGMHDRENVEVFCYALSPNEGTEWEICIQSEAEHFIDVSSLTFDATARMINEDRIQILIDLNGYTKGERSEIFAMQPAPIQVLYMGFPGTTAATYIDYLITDEKNRDVLDPNSQPTRSDYGLPVDKFIFACAISKRVPKSVLWLLRFPAAGEKRLRAYAAAQGLQQNRIIFTDVAMKREHIKRCSLADLFLDTPLCNALTTGTDVLWAGLGDEMIVSSMKEYEEKAVLLALNRPKLKNLTNRLKEYEEKALYLIQRAG
ncbi:hypothetical protein MTR67_041837 [Solanum verrucosum]|uniref:protein O-GlcNAc transferase n=1 Tax=Solanum verrucosum TaxID=315347 RepID=A0AAF0ZQM5_SOLVR|nr:hypothetical protein MTR67_041837 [Solanum verrucosum]